MIDAIDEVLSNDVMIKNEILKKNIEKKCITSCWSLCINSCCQQCEKIKKDHIQHVEECEQCIINHCQSHKKN